MTNGNKAYAPRGKRTSAKGSNGLGRRGHCGGGQPRKINIFNPSAEKILKFKAEEVMGRPVSEVLSPDIPMMISLGTGEGYDNEEIMLRTERGVSHYITTGRPIKDENNRIVGAVALIKDINRVLDLVYSMTSSPDITFDDILGVSEGMEYAKNVARMVAVSSSTVLIRGKRTGKELFARSIHRASRRKDRHFVPVNCGALPDTLLESELFGYEEGPLPEHVRAANRVFSGLPTVEPFSLTR